MTATSEELESRLSINKDMLDTEVIEQPELFYMAAFSAAEAISEYDALRETCKQVQAEVYVEIRAEAESSGKKVTEATLSALTETDKRVVESKRALTEALKIKELAEARKEAFIQRGWMLKELCNMYVSGYLSTETVKRADSVTEKAMEKMIHDRRKKISSAGKS
jgi:hypothetical protein